MKSSSSFFRCLQWLNFPGVVLLAILQRTPVLRVVTNVGELGHAAPLGQVLRSVVAAAASLGTVHSLAGATQFVQNPSGVVRGTVGTAVSVAFTITGSPQSPNFFTLDSALPPGLGTIPAAQGNRIPSGSPVITGTPTQAGTFNVSLTGSDGSHARSDTITFIITGGANTTPAITAQPSSQAVNLGATAIFSVAAGGTPTPTLQWRKDGAAIAGATGATLTLTNVQAAAAGTYSVVATNSVGTAISGNATLTVNAATAAPAIITQPSNQITAIGQSATFSVVATGNPAPTFQWLKNSVPVLGATASSFTIANAQLSDAASYLVNITNAIGTVTSGSASLNVNVSVSAPSISAAPPASLVISPGSTLALAVTANGSPTPSYQWQRNGVALGGATNSTLVLTGANATAGAYTVVASNSVRAVTSSPSNVSVASNNTSSRLINLSILTTVSAADPVFTLGTVLGGADTRGNKALLVRAVGPSLSALGVVSTLDDPKLEMFAGSATFATNNDWAGVAALGNAFAQVGAFAYTSGSSKDAALFNAAMPARDYTVQVSSNVAGSSGTVIAELYDATAAKDFSAASPRLINVSVRKQIDAGATLTAGFVIGPLDSPVARTVLVRAIGPGLGAFGVPGTMADPKLELFSGANVIAANDNWGGDAQLTATGTAVGAFAIANSSSKDAMLLVTLAPGNYTAQVSGIGGGGVALVEVYEVP